MCFWGILLTPLPHPLKMEIRSLKNTCVLYFTVLYLFTKFDLKRHMAVLSFSLSGEPLFTINKLYKDTSADCTLLSVLSSKMI